MPRGATTLSITTFSIMTLSITTFSISLLSMKTLSIAVKNATLSKMTFKGASLGQTLVLPTNIRLGWKGLPGINTLAYYKNQ